MIPKLLIYLLRQILVIVCVIAKSRNICSFFSCTKNRSVDANENFSDNENMFDDKKDIYFPIKVSSGESNVAETIMSPLS